MEGISKAHIVTTDIITDTICAKQAASLIGCSTWTLYEYCKDGLIPHIRVGRLLRFRRSTLETWLTQCEAASLKGAA